MISKYFFTPPASLRHSQNFFSTGLISHDNGYPTLSCKAWNGRVLLIFLTRCLDTLGAQVHDTEICLSASTCKALCVFFDRMERAGRYLSDLQANELASACTAFIRGYDKLARLCVQKNVSRFKLIPKMHICRHFAEDIVRFKYNIKYRHCYKDEDCVEIMKRLACKVHAGSLMEYRIICRWLLRVSCWMPGTGS